MQNSLRLPTLAHQRADIVINRYFTLRLSEELRRAATAPTEAERAVHLAPSRLLRDLAGTEPECPSNQERCSEG